jgi:hypothetical protein
VLKALAALSLNFMNVWIVETDIQYQEIMIFPNATNIRLSSVLGAGMIQNHTRMGEEYN